LVLSAVEETLVATAAKSITPMKSKNRGLVPPQSKRRPAVLASSIAALAALCIAPRPAHAQTWTPFASTDWNTAANWTPNVVPNGSGTSVTIGVTNLTSITLSEDTEVGAITFTINAFPESLMTEASAFTISGAGITNNSTHTQNFTAGAGVNGLGGSIHFVNSATAGSSTQFTANGATAVSPLGGTISFTDNSTAGSATLINNGGNGAGASGGLISFTGTASLDSATIITNGGTNGGEGGTTLVSGNGPGSTTSTIITNGNGSFDMSGRTNSGLSVGSIAGSGNYFLGANQLVAGGNNTSTTVSGIIADGGQSGGVGGSLLKNGTGTLTLTGANIYTGATTVNTGTLQLGTAATAGSIATASVITVFDTLSVVNTGGSLANTIHNFGVTNFSRTTTAGSATIINELTGASAGTTNFSGNSTAGHATISNFGNQVSTVGGSTNFSDSATAGSASITAAGGTFTGGGGGQILFQDTSSAGSASLQANTGASGGLGGTILFQGNADGGTATAIINAGATFDISGLTSGGMKIGSISGAGTFNLGDNTLTVGGSGINATISGVIEGSGSLVESGAGSLTLTGQNTYTGTTSIINGGTINANIAGALPAPAADGGAGTPRAALSMDHTGTGGSTLNLGANQAVASLTGAASSTIHLNGNTLTVGAMLGATSTYAGVIADGTGSGGLTVDGNGVLNLTGNNTYTGQTNINGTSSLVVGNQSTGNLTGTSGVSVADGATLLVSLASGSVFRPNVVLNGSGASLLMTEVGTNTVSGVISGQGSVAQDASGTTILTGAQTYTGGTAVNAGTLQLGTAGAAASITNSVTVHDRGTLTLVNVAGGTSIPRPRSPSPAG
jgi:fibronectin-binding autotransporter adhesin